MVRKIFDPPRCGPAEAQISACRQDLQKFASKQFSTKNFEIDVFADDCENNLYHNKMKTLEYLRDFDLSLKYENISLDIDDIQTDCNVNNTLELRINNMPIGAIGFLSNDSRFTKNVMTFMKLVS